MLDKSGVGPVERDKVSVGAVLDDAALVEDEDHVRVSHGAEAVRDEDAVRACRVVKDGVGPAFVRGVRVLHRRFSRHATDRGNYVRWRTRASKLGPDESGLPMPTHSARWRLR